MSGRARCSGQVEALALATMPMMVNMQAPRPVATRSVGEKDSPRPWVSTGASVESAVREGP